MATTTPLESENVRRTCQNESIDFTTRDHEKILQSLRLVNPPIPELAAGLKDYLSVLSRGSSLALSRGEDLASIRLSKSIESLFSTATPRVIDGPPITWTMLILFAGPQFDGPSRLKIGETEVELPEDDLNLVRSGRPWRFLSPWPDSDDCEKELRSVESALWELNDTKLSITAVLSEISVVEHRLRNRFHFITQRYANQRGGIPQEENPGCGSTPSRPPPLAGSGTTVPRVDENTASEHVPPFPANVPLPASEQSAQNAAPDPCNAGLSKPFVAGNSIQVDIPQPLNTVRPKRRSRASNFIATLRE
ncbi:hypothetical protein MW887_008612 [Aspergillus wentii]|nr:hypothetical protein MW887_008612 [Aspergillus wentii]